jgi:hypothetical protein
MKNKINYLILLFVLLILIYAPNIFPTLNGNNSMRWIVGGSVILYLFIRWRTDNKKED